MNLIFKKWLSKYILLHILMGDQWFFICNFKDIFYNSVHQINIVCPHEKLIHLFPVQSNCIIYLCGSESWQYICLYIFKCVSVKVCTQTFPTYLIHYVWFRLFYFVSKSVCYLLSFIWHNRLLCIFCKNDYQKITKN